MWVGGCRVKKFPSRQRSYKYKAQTPEIVIKMKTYFYSYFSESSYRIPKQ